MTIPTAALYDQSNVALYLGNCLNIMALMESNSIDAIVTDPPYHLITGKKGGSGAASLNEKSPAGRSRVTTGFMGQLWDGGDVAFQAETWSSILRVAKPGAHLVAFGGTRTYHRMACAIEDAGWEIRDCLMWIFGSGFPKSLDVSKQIDKMVGVTRQDLGPNPNQQGRKSDMRGNNLMTRRPVDDAGQFSRVTVPASKHGKEWAGWGTGLKPAYESIIIAQKPYPIDQERRIIVENLIKIEARLWSLLPVTTAMQSFGLSQVDFDEVLDFAQWSADERSNMWDDLFGQMDMSQSVKVISTCLSIVQLWKNVLADDFAKMNTSIIATGLSQTIAMTTLQSCVSGLTPRSIIEAEIRNPGSQCDAVPAARFLNAVCRNIMSIHELTALDIAIDKGHILPPDGIAKDLRYRPIILARKPLEGTVADNVLKWGTGAMNIDQCRIPVDDEAYAKNCSGDRGHDQNRTRQNDFKMTAGKAADGRWPANLIHDGSEEVLAAFPDAPGQQRATGPDFAPKQGTPVYGDYGPRPIAEPRTDSGSSARFFYTAKASASDRGHEEWDELPLFGEPAGEFRNTHPTVKPLALMRYLLTLVSRDGSLVLDPFAGSGSTLVAAKQLGRKAIGMDLDQAHLDIAIRRLEKAKP